MGVFYLCLVLYGFFFLPLFIMFYCGLLCSVSQNIGAYGIHIRQGCFYIVILLKIWHHCTQSRHSHITLVWCGNWVDDSSQSQKFLCPWRLARSLFGRLRCFAHFAWYVCHEYEYHFTPSCCLCLWKYLFQHISQPSKLLTGGYCFASLDVYSFGKAPYALLVLFHWKKQILPGTISNKCISALLDDICLLVNRPPIFIVAFCCLDLTEAFSVWF